MTRTVTALLAAAGLLLGGCGGAPVVPDQPSALSVRLGQVDAALASRDYVQARRDLTALATQARAARLAGDLTEAQEEKILAAIATLRGTLPAVATSTSATPSATPTLSRSPAAPAKAKPGKGAAKHGPKKKPGKGKGPGKPKG